MSEQRDYLLSLPRLDRFSLRVHGDGQVRSGDENEIYVLLRLPRGKCNLVLNRHYNPIGYLSPKDSAAEREFFAPVETSRWNGDYPCWGFNWKDGTWFDASLAGEVLAS